MSDGGERERIAVPDWMREPKVVEQPSPLHRLRERLGGAAVAALVVAAVFTLVAPLVVAFYATRTVTDPEFNPPLPGVTRDAPTAWPSPWPSASPSR
jgi:hypothetical protein